MKKPIYAVFDVGKTNKKLLLFDEDHQIIDEQQEIFPEITDEDGFPCDDLERLTNWVQTNWQILRHHPDFQLKGVNFTAYGASFVHLGSDGRPVLPLYSYIKPFPKSLADQFYTDWAETTGNLDADTCSPRLGMLNSGLQLYWLKYAKPQEYARIATSLHLPQYLSYLVTGELFSDYTSVGCHTALWDFRTQSYHEWVRQEGIDRKLAPLTRDSVASVVDGILIGVGLHDSSSAIIPYQLQSEEPFLLLSTGTWCINLNPFNHQPLTPDQLRRDCLSYLSPKGQMTKASRIFLGREHDYQVERIARHFNVQPEFYKSLVFAALNDTAVDDFAPACMAGTGPYPDQPAREWDLSGYPTAASAYQSLMRGLVNLLKDSIDLVSAGEKTIYIDGGFVRNPLFRQLLGWRFPNQTIRTLEIPQATALGALMHLEQGEAQKKKQLLFI